MAACNSELGPRSFHHRSHVSSSFFSARGRKRQTRMRIPSLFLSGWFQRLVLIMRDSPLPLAARTESRKQPDLGVYPVIQVGKQVVPPFDFGQPRLVDVVALDLFVEVIQIDDM